MKNVKTYTGRVVITGRLPSSVNGNPRFTGYVETVEKAFQHAWVKRVEFVTAVDSMIGYAIQNYDGKNCTVEIGSHYKKPTIHSIEVRTL